MIKLIVGLGNPTAEYANTRHNAGFWWVDELASSQNRTWQFNKGLQAELTQYQPKNGSAIWLCKPQTYMNRSGLAVAMVANYYKIAVDALLVVYDDLDLPCGSIKLKNGGGLAGHNGLKSLKAQLGTDAFWRLRIGIDHPRNLNMNQGVADYVLSRPSHAQLTQIDEAMQKAWQLSDEMITGDMNEVVRKLHSA